MPRHCAHQGFGRARPHRAAAGSPLRATLRVLARACRLSSSHRDDGDLLRRGWRAATDQPAGRRTVNPSGRCCSRPAAASDHARRDSFPGRARRRHDTGTLQQQVISHGQRPSGTPSRDRRRRARQLLGHCDARPCRRTGRLPTVTDSSDISRSSRSASAPQRATAGRFGTRTRLTRIAGARSRGPSSAVELEHLTQRGARRMSSATSLVLTADWIPDHELAMRAGLTIDPLTRGPASTRRCAVCARRVRGRKRAARRRDRRSRRPGRTPGRRAR